MRKKEKRKRERQINHRNKTRGERRYFYVVSSKLRIALFFFAFFFFASTLFFLLDELTPLLLLSMKTFALPLFRAVLPVYTTPIGTEQYLFMNTSRAKMRKRKRRQKGWFAFFRSLSGPEYPSFFGASPLFHCCWCCCVSVTKEKGKKIGSACVLKKWNDNEKEGSMG